MKVWLVSFPGFLFYYMLHRQVILATHMGSGGSMLMEMVLSNRKAAALLRTPTQVYSDPTSLSILQADAKSHYPHARLFIDKVTFNYEIMNSQYFKMCDFIFLLREPSGTLNHIIESGKLKPEAAIRYYTFRLRRLCEMAQKCPRKIVISWDEIVDKSCIPNLKDFLHMKELHSFYRTQEAANGVDLSLIMQGKKSYDKHLGYLRAIAYH